MKIALLALALFYLASQDCNADNSGSKYSSACGIVSNGFQLCIMPASSIVMSGQAIYLNMILKNRGTNTITVDPLHALFNCSINLIDPYGRGMKTSVDGERYLRDPSRVVSFLEVQFPPGSELTNEYPLSLIYDIHEIGRNKIFAEKIFRSVDGIPEVHLFSNEATIDVIGVVDKKP